MMPIRYNTPGLTIAHDPCHRLLLLTWQGGHSGRSAQDCCVEVLAQVQATASTKILNDARLDEGGWQEIVHWLAHKFLGQLADSGVLAIAWVTPHSLRAHIHMNEVVSNVTRPLVDDFKEVESAYAWLSQKILVDM